MVSMSSLAAKKLMLLGVLSLQIGYQPLLMSWYAKEATNVSLRLAVIELLKLVLAIVPLAVQGELVEQVRGWSGKVALRTTAAPALIYLVQNYLNQNAVVLLDGVTFNILNQTKIIWTALLVYVMLRKPQSKQQIVALALLCAAAVLMTSGPRQKHAKDANKDEKEEAMAQAAFDAAFFTGSYQALIAAVLSALAGTIIQRALQQQKRNTYMVTVELSLLAQVTLALIAMGKAVHDSGQEVTAEETSKSLLDGWTIMTVFTLLCQAAGGMVVGFVIKYCGNVEKSFAVVVGMIITALLEQHYNNKPFGGTGLIAIAMVTVSTMMYTMYPPAKAGTKDDPEEEESELPLMTKHSSSNPSPSKSDSTTSTSLSSWSSSSEAGEASMTYSEKNENEMPEESAKVALSITTARHRGESSQLA